MNRYEIKRREGFWKSKTQPHLPVVRLRKKPWRNVRVFLTRLREVESQLAKKHHFKGFSSRRICNDNNGSVTYEHGGWLWPSGFAHYVERHNVRPSLAFEEFILGHYIDEE